MKSRTTVFLIAALAACVAYVVMSRGGLFKSDENPRTQDAQALFSEMPGEPVELAVTSQAGARIKFRLGPTGWRIVEPLATIAIDDRIVSLVDAIVSIECLQRYETADSNAPDATVTGLDSPRWTVTLTDDKQQTYGVEIGQHVPLSGKTRTYVRLAGDKRVCIAAGDLTEPMSRPVSYYRSPKVLEIPADAIMSVRIEGGETYSIQRKLQGEWIIKSGTDNKEQFPADKRETETFLKRLTRIDARQFVDDNPTDLAPYGLAAGGERLKVTVAFVTKNTAAKSRTIAIGVRTGAAGGETVFAKLTDHPTVFTLPASMLDELQPGTLRLRDKAVLPITAEAVTKIELALESGSMTLVKTDDKWSISSPTKAPANQQRVRLILDRLTALRAKGFRREKASEVQFGFDKPRGVIGLFEADSDKPTTLTIGADSPAGAAAFVKSSSANVVAVVGALDVGIFLAPTVRCHDATLWRLGDRTDVSRIALKRADSTVELTGDVEGRWRITKPLDAPADIENVNSILDHLDDLTATRIVSVGAKTRAYYAKGAGAISATFEVRAQDAPTSRPSGRTHAFNMAILDGKVYGWMSDDPLARVGLFSGKLYQQFNAELRRRKVLDFDPESVTGITLTLGSEPMTLTKLDSGWKYPEDPELKIDQDAVTKYLEQIKSLRAIRFVSSDETPDEKFGLEKSKAWLSLELTTNDKKTITVLVSRTGSNETANRYASTTGLRGAFTISAEAAVKMARKIADFK
ncbi:MAG: DUF4340 domain-containing protein [Phycisphaerae bacterium]|nr:DUF4340 domain-containing protein [Phycisphaerae bacterium]